MLPKVMKMTEDKIVITMFGFENTGMYIMLNFTGEWYNITITHFMRATWFVDSPRDWLLA